MPLEMVVGRGTKREAEKHNPKGIVDRKKTLIIMHCEDSKTTIDIRPEK